MTVGSIHVTGLMIRLKVEVVFIGVVLVSAVDVMDIPN